MTPLETAHRWLHRLGLDVVRYPGQVSALGRRLRLIEHHQIDVIFDIGANEGQYASELRSLGFRGRIVSFEPLPSAFDELARRASRDPAWQANLLAMGDHVGEATLHVAGNAVSSSLLGMLPAHLDAAPSSRFVDDIQVRVGTLDEAIGEFVRRDERLLVKVDAQGYEAHILAGAAQRMDQIQGFQLELSLVPLYEGCPKATALVDKLEGHGFRLMSLEPGFLDPHSGQLLQVDGIFFRAPPPRVGAASSHAYDTEGSTSG